MLRLNAPRSAVPTLARSVPETTSPVYAKKKFTHFATTCPDGLVVGWDYCGSCTAGLKVCQCKGGVTAPSGVLHIYVSAGGVLPDVKVESRPPLSTREALGLKPAKKKLTLPKVKHVEPRRLLTPPVKKKGR